MAMAIIGPITTLMGFVTTPYFAASSTMGVIGYVHKNDPLPAVTQITVFAGMGPELNGDWGGNKPGVSLWDQNGAYMGRANGARMKILKGNHFNIKVHHIAAVGNIVPEYAAISDGGKDGICLAGIGFDYSDGGGTAWTGDQAFMCGGETNWYHSNTPFGSKHERPRCIWIDRDRSHGVPHQGFAIHLPDMDVSPLDTTGRKAKIINKDHRVYCASPPRFSMYKNLRVEDNIPIFWPPLEYNVTDLTDLDVNKVLNPTTRMAQKREWNCNDDSDYCFRPRFAELVGRKITQLSDWVKDLVPRQSTNPHAGKLIQSPHETHSAAELCNSPTSYGPDFVSLAEGQFCDMDTKALYPVCKDGEKMACFDLETDELRQEVDEEEREAEQKNRDEGRKRRAVGVPLAPAVVRAKRHRTIKSWRRVIEWGDEASFKLK